MPMRLVRAMTEVYLYNTAFPFAAMFALPDEIK